MADTYNTTELFGGAIVCDIPSSWEDISRLRQVPDHQEIYFGAKTVPEEPLLVVEIMEYQPSVTNKEAAKYFFDDLNAANGGESDNFTSITWTEEGGGNGTIPHMSAGVGMQKMAMGRDTDAYGNFRTNQEVRWVSVELCVVRLPRVESEILVTISRSKLSNEAATDLSGELKRVLSTIRIRDWTLFG